MYVARPSREGPLFKANYGSTRTLPKGPVILLRNVHSRLGDEHWAPILRGLQNHNNNKKNTILTGSNLQARLVHDASFCGEMG